ncbi:hypothetical protein T484DRAFT_1762398 [Baffinella frigidus]|nr:hypothetical protein T484DRAFT_1762398 [Cryptophyta sp. CCMP2293]
MQVDAAAQDVRLTPPALSHLAAAIGASATSAGDAAGYPALGSDPRYGSIPVVRLEEAVELLVTGEELAGVKAGGEDWLLEVAAAAAHRGMANVRLLEVAAAAAHRGMANVRSTHGILRRMREDDDRGNALSPESRAALVQVLKGSAAHGMATMEDAEENPDHGMATMEDAEEVMSHIDRSKDRPSADALLALLDVVVAETSSGKATHLDAIRILTRMRGCGFTPGPDEYRKGNG